MFRVEPNGRIIEGATLPWIEPDPCGRYFIGDVYIGGPPCGYELKVPCRAQIEVIFVSSVSAILSARTISPPGVCTDTCVVWNALPLHPESVAISTPVWAFVKRLFR